MRNILQTESADGACAMENNSCEVDHNVNEKRASSDVPWLGALFRTEETYPVVFIVFFAA